MCAAWTQQANERSFNHDVLMIQHSDGHERVKHTKNFTEEQPFTAALIACT